MRIGIVAPSAVVPLVELKLGVDRLKKAGFEVEVHSQCRARHGFFAGDDGVRAQAFYEYATRSDLDAIWCARGGYGAARILPILDELIRQGGLPSTSKLFLGFSDATVLHEYVRTRWGWKGIHAPMPGARPFSYQSAALWKELLEQVRSGGKNPFQQKLKWLSTAPRKPVQGTWLGGNLKVLSSVVGTPYSMQASQGILFVEDISEAAYQLDRTWIQLEQSGALKGLRAIVLGTFEACQDRVPPMLKSAPKSEKLLRNPRPADLKPLRPTMSESKMLREIFGSAGERLGIPVAYGLKVGHGDQGLRCMPMGGMAQLAPSGLLSLTHSQD